MPQVVAAQKILACPAGSNLRHVLLNQEVPVHNGRSRLINCRGLGSCGTCAVKVEEDVSPPTWRDLARRSLPPHTPTRDLRLACQTSVVGDIRVTKYDGFWGQGTQPVWSAERATEGE
ncbi:(2Fe-2S)-binding protein [filamentous cyanobacterium CCP5]|nr:(2Fe-2S)-binding protein [filamentous cyanobacterium CCP5]